MKNIAKNKRLSRLWLLCALVVCAAICLSACNFGINAGGSVPEAPKVEISDKLELPEYVQDLIQLDEVFKHYSYEGVDEEAMKKALLKAYIEAIGDPYAEYLDAEEYEAYFSDRSGEFVGVGVSVVNTTINVNGYDYKVIQVISVFKDSPALKAGIRVGDCVMYVGKGSERELVV